LHYEPICSAAIKNKTLKYSAQADTLVLVLRTTIVALIKHYFLKKGGSLLPGKRQRSKMLDEFRPWLSRIKTFKCCLPCMIRAPEHKLPCGHMICEECYKDMGRSFATDPHFYELHQCPICAKPQVMSLRVKPVTAGSRVLSIDGGGIRAVVPIEFLRALEREIGLDMPIQEHFDLAYGTSSGMFSIAISYTATYSLSKALW
jgi:hypothetical protein